jgi:hypothetical protein
MTVAGAVNETISAMWKTGVPRGSYFLAGRLVPQARSFAGVDSNEGLPLEYTPRFTLPSRSVAIGTEERMNKKVILYSQPG